MACYLIIEIKVLDSDLYSQYVQKVPEVVSNYGGRYLARGGEVTPITGNWNPERVILIEFDSIDQVQRCFQSSEYLELAPLREKSTRSRAIIVQGSPSLAT